MGQFVQEIPEHLIEWILKQEMFWVASAPLSADGHVNISPKGVEGTFHVVNSRRVWYEDLSGTGAETVAHIRENGRITILFQAFEGPARIVRLYGKGFFYEIGTPEYEALLPTSQRQPGSRAVIGLDIHKVGTTCGYAVPYYKFISHRTQLNDWAAKKESSDRESDSLSVALAPLALAPLPSQAPTNERKAPNEMQHPPDTHTLDAPGAIASKTNPNGMRHWWELHNIRSLDGLPAFSVGLGLKYRFGTTLARVFGAKGRVPPVLTQASVPRNSASSNPYIPDNIVPRHMGTLTIENVAIDKPSSESMTVALARAIDSYQDLSSLVLVLLPFILIFAFGLLLGREYERSSNIYPGYGRPSPLSVYL
ncbi:hypothetical protein B0H34DRAFT_676494 [Crassisporium funariophilum]|nr:hypothetical protein B0H34DRAFT_676494 [Crassisporium funariophilum]